MSKIIKNILAFPTLTIASKSNFSENNKALDENKSSDSKIHQDLYHEMGLGQNYRCTQDWLAQDEDYNDKDAWIVMDY